MQPKRYVGISCVVLLLVVAYRRFDPKKFPNEVPRGFQLKKLFFFALESNTPRFQNESTSSTAPSATHIRNTNTRSSSTLVVIVISVSAVVTAGIIGLAVACYICRRRRSSRFI